MDREKVIKGLNCCAHTDGSNCKYCPYDITSEDCTALMAMDVLDLLKEHEPVKPYMDFDGHDVWRCGNCGATIFHLQHTQADEDAKNYAKFCRLCGRAVDWNL